ncbi:hypothetical protein HG536_0B00220 [Torulaspora globosa]|uniref:DNA replication checkpoint mediator MRC1 domain-containing protein n=1 Tax=Torulaspora globosa TaxID=48254 RepID=A0A7G3ZCC5_9SACH|nr:uncharacterized protein HG536_0B00220 [Torulaspora globosa]QLL31161.1 hypothetical protein HG536_0B00220 [Torulaspora globosa]
MDQLLQDLDAAKTRRKTTYKKVLRHDDEPPEASLSAVLGDGFLFQSDVLNRVKKRLDNESCETVHFSETSMLSNLYGDAEEVETETLTAKEWNQKVIQPKPKTNEKPVLHAINDGLIGKQEGLKSPPTADEAFRRRRSMTISDAGSNADGMTQPILECSAEARTQLISPMKEPKQASEGTAKIVSQTKSSEVPQILTPCDDDAVSCNDLQSTAADFDDPTKLKIHEIQEQLKNENEPTYTKFEAQKATSQKNVVFSREAFMKDFDNSSDSDSEVPYQQTVAIHNTQNSDELEQRSRTVHKSGSLNAYERELKQQLEQHHGIALSSESESSEDDRVSPSFASKATVLEIRARISKRKVRTKARGGGASLTALISNLRKASKEQIIQCQKEMVERHGMKLQDIEKEKEMVENLLEQEIARNKRIRMREREKDNRSVRTSSPQKADKEGFTLMHSNKSQEVESDRFSLSGSNSDDSNFESDQDETSLQAQKTPAENADPIYESDDENISRSKVRAHKTLILSENDLSDENDDSIKEGIDLGSYGGNLSTKSVSEESHYSGDEDTQPVTEELEREHRNFIKEEMKRRALKESQEINEMRKSGVSNMFDMEAEESDDEWHGLGGAEGESIDNYDSDLEKMIDDFSHTTSNANQIRQLLIAENKETDLKTVNKILNDLKNGGFRKRRNNDLQLELSDYEDDELRNYRRKRLETMRKKRLQFGQSNSELLKNTKSKAFFDSMLEDLMENGPFENQAQKVEAQDDKHDTKETVAISREFVLERLSFLNGSRDSGEFDVTQPAGEDGLGTDLLNLKRSSSVKSLDNPHSAKTEEEDYSYTLPAEGRYISVVKSFGDRSDLENKLKNGKKTVTVSKSYRTVGGSKTSITYLAKMRKLVAPKANRPLKPKLDELASLGKRKIFGSFDSSFET